MLVLERRINERIMIGDDIIIQVCRFRDGKVWLGITAPRDVAVHREEIKRLVDEERHEHRTA